MEIGPSQLARLTAGKGVANTAFRWLPFFLPTLAVAFNSSTGTLALVLGIAEAFGLATLLAGRWLDAGHERRVIIIALITIALSSAVAMIGSVVAFAVTAVMVGTSAAFVAIGGHAWISARVGFDRRARSIGIYEMSWASALLVGAPLVALLIELFGWRGPFIAIAGAALVAAVLVWTVDDGQRTDRPSPASVSGADGTGRVPITADAWLVVAMSSSLAMAGLTTIVVAGTWLAEVHNVSTGGVGLVAMTFGAAELTASTGSSVFADRIGKRRSIQFSTALILAGIAVITSSGASLLIGALGLLAFFLGFEYSIVTSFSLVSEAMPTARGRVLGLGSAMGTLARGVGVSAAGFLYGRFGIGGPAAVSAVAAAISFALLAVLARRRPDLA